MRERQRITLDVHCPVCLGELAVRRARRGFTAWCPSCRVRVFLPQDADTEEYRDAAFEQLSLRRQARRRI